MSRRIVWTLGLVMAVGLLHSTPARAQDPGRQAERQYGVVGRDTREGAAMNSQLDRVVRRISNAAHFHLKSVTILGGRSRKLDQEINAFALPDGRVYVLKGLMTAVQNEPDPDGELAFVVGHEMTHVIKHHSAMIQRGSILGALGGAMLGRLLGGRNGLQWGEQLGSTFEGMHYSRDAEYQADAGGLLAMHRAGYPMDDAIAALNMIRRKYGDRNAGWLADHPMTRHRVAHLERQIAQIRAGRSPANR